MTTATATIAAPKTLIIQRATQPQSIAETLELAKVSVTGYHYRVDFGLGVIPRIHHVAKDKTCSCDLVKNCPAIHAVAAYLKAGGERAADPPPGYFVTKPARCPQCGAPTHVDTRLSSSIRGIGWTCEKLGSVHYWNTRGDILRENFRVQPWLFPPAVIRNGQYMKAWDGIQPGDKVLYEGLRRMDVASSMDGFAYGYLPENFVPLE